MKPPVLVLLALLAWGAEPAIADLCTDPVQTICRTSGAAFHRTADQVRSELGQAVSLIPLSRRSDVGTYRSYLSAAFKNVVARLAKIGIHETEVRERIESVRGLLVRSLEKGRIGSQELNAESRSNAALAASVRSITPLFLPRDDREALAFYQWCGMDGLAVNAAFMSDSGMFFVCPGMLLEALDFGSLNQLDHVVAHELMHSVDARSGRHGRYGRYLSCVRDGLAGEFESIERVIEQMGQPAEERLQAYLEQLMAAPGDIAAAILEAQDQLSKATWQRSYLNAVREEFRGSLGRDPSVVDTHSAELTADLGSNEVLLERLRSMPKRKRADALVASMRYLCGGNLSPARLVRFGSLKDDGLHPSTGWRVDSLIGNPEVRLLLGCKDLVGKRAWCPAGDSAPLVARCDRSAKAGSGSRCEALVGRGLASVGCQFSGLECGPYDGDSSDCTFSSSNCMLPSRELGSGALACPKGEREAELKRLGSVIPGVCVGPIAQGGPAAPISGPESSEAR